MNTQLRDDLILVCEKLLGWTVETSGDLVVRPTSDTHLKVAVNLDANLAHEVKQAILKKGYNLENEFMVAIYAELRRSGMVVGVAKGILQETPELIITAAAQALRSVISPVKEEA